MTEGGDFGVGLIIIVEFFLQRTDLLLNKVLLLRFLHCVVDLLVEFFLELLDERGLGEERRGLRLLVERLDAGLRERELVACLHRGGTTPPSGVDLSEGLLCCVGS